MKYILYTCILLLSLSVAGTTLAEEQDQARIQFDQGIKLYDEQKYEQASIAFERAYELKPSYRILYNIGQVENELGHWARAKKAFEQYLEEGKERIEKERIEEIKKEIARLETLVGRIAIDNGPVGALVLVDHEEVGELPLSSPVQVDLGRHEVTIEHDGQRVFERVIKVAGGEYVSIEIKAASESVNDDETEDIKKSKRLKKGPFIVAASITAALGAGLIATDFIVRDAYDKAKTSPDDDSLKDDVTTLQKIEWTLVGVTAAGLITTCVLGFITDFKGEKKKDPKVRLVAPALFYEGAMIVFRGSF